MRRLFRWFGGIVLATVLLAVAAAGWLLATESGARWLLAQSSPLLPDALSIDEVNGTLIAGLSFRGLGWADTTATVTVAELDTKVELPALLKREVRIERLRVRDVDVRLGDSPTEKTDPEPFTIDLPVALGIENAVIENARVVLAGNAVMIETIKLGGRLSGSALEIDRLEVHSELGDIGLSGNARLAGTFPAKVNAAWDLRLPDQPALSGLLEVDGDSSGYRVDHRLDAPYEISTLGTVALLDEGIKLDLENRWQQLSIEQGIGRVIEAADGTLRIAGVIGDLNFDAATTLSSADIPAAAFQARGRIVDDRVDFASLSVSNEWGKLLASGAFFYSGEPHWSFDIDLTELDPAVADARLTGDLSITAKTAGQLVDQQPVLELQVERIAGDLNNYAVDGSGDFSYANGQFKFVNTAVRVGDNRLDLNGSYGARLEVNAKADLPDLSQLGLGIAGAMKSDFRVASDLKTFTAVGNVTGENLVRGDYVIEQLDAEFDLPAAGDGTALLRIDSAELGGVSAEIGGRFTGERWSGAIKNLAVRREPVGEWTLREAAGFSLSRSGFNLQKACLVTASTAGEACVAFDYDVAGPLSFETTINALPLAALAHRLPEGATLLGDVSTEARGEFADGLLNSSFRLQVDGLGLIASFEGDEVSELFEKASVDAAIVNNKLTGEFDFRLDNSIDHATGSIELDNLFDQESALRAQASLELNDLTLFSFFFPDVANPLGKIAGRIEATGTLPTPEISGELGLRDGSVDIRRAGISVTEIGLLLRQSKVGELVLEGSAKSGDGYLQINGETLFSEETGIRSDIKLNGEDFGLVRLPDWQVTASPTITVLFDERETRVNGRLGIPRASITIQTVPETTEKPSPDAVVHRRDATPTTPQRMLHVDVTTLLGADVSFSGFGLTTGLEGSVRISGNSRSPYKSQGRVVLREGRYQAYGQKLEIESGELIFSGPLTKPALNVRATRTASDKTVAGIHLTGTPDQLRSEVYSEPPLGDAEALSYLLTGRPLNDANSAEGNMLNQAAFALGLTSAGSVASQVRDELGLDTLGFQGGADNTQLVAGKRLNERLSIEYAYGVVDSLGTLLLRYQLSQRLMVESRSGAVRTVDVVYSVKKP